jgi:diacyltrehalose acyltransferase
MAKWRKRLVPLIAATFLMLGTGPVATAVSAAEEAVLIPGATVFKRINPLYPIVAATYPSIGIHFHDKDANLHLVDYSQNALASDKAILDGVKQADIVVRQVDGKGKVVIIGESMGSMVAARLAAKLASSADPPSTEDVSFVLIAPPEAGVAEYFKEGTFIPVLNYRISRVAESPYPTTIVIGEYDGWADPPDRPWNLVSSFNALAGIVYVHGPPIFTADPVPGENTTTHTNGAGGIVTTIFVPTKNLPLTQVFRDVGVPDALVDKADQVLRPIVDAGYRRHDEPGDPRPYLHDGEIHRNVQSQQLVREPRREESGDAQEPSVNPGQQRQAGGDDRLDQSDPDLQESKNDLDGQQSKNDADVQESENEPDTQESKNDPDAQESKDESRGVTAGGG